MTTDSRARILADFARVAPVLPGERVPWLNRLRRNALERFAQSGFPTARDEEWKYTSVAAIEKRPFTAMSNGHDKVAPAELDALAAARFGSHRLVFVNGRYAPALSAIGRLPAELTLLSLADALDRVPDALSPLLSGDGGPTVGGQTVFGALNTAFMADGTYLHLRRGTAVEEPIHLLFISTVSGVAIYPRNVLAAEEVRGLRSSSTTLAPLAALTLPTP